MRAHGVGYYMPAMITIMHLACFAEKKYEKSP